MKLKIFSMLVTLTILSVMPLIYMGKFDPMAFFDSGLSGGLNGGMDKGMAEFKKLKAKAPKNLTSVVTDEKVQVYQWRDEHGVMQYSNTPPMDAQAKQVTLDPNHNLIQATKVPPKETEAPAAAPTNISRPYSVQGMKQVVDDAKGVEELLQKRHEQQQKMLNNL